MKNNNFRPFLLFFLIIAFFIFVVSFFVFYSTENFSPVCGCRLPPWVIIVSMSSLGLFVGLITYYIASNSFLKEKKGFEKNFLKILDLLEDDDKKVLIQIIKNKGIINQSVLTKQLNIDKVKVSRIVSKLIKKGIIKKEKSGMTNKLFLNEDLMDFFIY